MRTLVDSLWTILEDVDPQTRVTRIASVVEGEYEVVTVEARATTSPPITIVIRRHKDMR